MASILSRLREGLAKTAQQIRERLGVVEEQPAVQASTPGARRTGLETLEALEDALLTADVGLGATELILDRVRAGREGSIRDRVERVMLEILTDVAPDPAVT